jgi:hypothetical protein
VLAPRSWDTDEDYCYRSLGFLESFISLIVLISVLVGFLLFALVVFSHVAFDEEMAFSGCVFKLQVKISVVPLS